MSRYMRLEKEVHCHLDGASGFLRSCETTATICAVAG
jgi:hypothetical protein